MPQLNRRGPEGTGPMTGRGMGRCNPENKGKLDEEILQQRGGDTPTQAGSPEAPIGRGLGKGRGPGGGSGRGSGRGLGRGAGRGAGRGM